MERSVCPLRSVVLEQAGQLMAIEEKYCAPSKAMSSSPSARCVSQLALAVGVLQWC